jgi:hypothetical protein
MSSGNEGRDVKGTEEEEELPSLIRIKDEEGEPPPETVLESVPRVFEQRSPSTWTQPRPGETSDPRTWKREPRWSSAEQGIRKRHERRNQAFRNRTRQVNQGTCVELSKPSPITEQMELESVEKGSPLWNERQALHWKLEIERMFVPWPVRANESLERMDERREWTLGHLEIPFLRYPRRGENAVQIMDVPDNQRAVQEMVTGNPLFKEAKWWNLWLDKLHPELVIERNRRLVEDRCILEERWPREHEKRARERQAQALVQDRRAESVEQNLGQWIRQIEDDERRRIKSPTERRTRERRQETQDHRRYLERGGKFQGIIEDVRRLPNGPERQEVFRRFWAKLYTQEFQG